MGNTPRTAAINSLTPKNKKWNTVKAVCANSTPGVRIHSLSRPVTTLASQLNSQGREENKPKCDIRKKKKKGW